MTLWRSDCCKSRFVFSVEDFMKEVYDSNADSKQWQSFTPSAVKFTNEDETPKEVTDVMLLIIYKG